jgi:hypothetical protein
MEMREIKLQDGTYLFKDMNGYEGLLDYYMIISTTKDITEGQAESIVGRKFGGRYYEFLKPGMMRVSSMQYSYPFDTAKESLESLVNSLGLDINKNYLILKKI